MPLTFIATGIEMERGCLPSKVLLADNQLRILKRNMIILTKKCTQLRMSNNQEGKDNHEFMMKVDILYFHGNLNIEEILDWLQIWRGSLSLPIAKRLLTAKL